MMRAVKEEENSDDSNVYHDTLTESKSYVDSESFAPESDYYSTTEFQSNLSTSEVMIGDRASFGRLFDGAKSRVESNLRTSDLETTTENQNKL